MSLRDVSPLTVPLAIVSCSSRLFLTVFYDSRFTKHEQVTHQLFRRYEIHSASVHAFLFLVPPVVIAGHASSQPFCALSFSAVFFNALLSYLLALLMSVIVYRLSPFHPLAQYPGPLWRRASMIGPAILAATGRRAKAFRDLHQKYGDVVRSGMLCR